MGSTIDPIFDAIISRDLTITETTDNTTIFNKNSTFTVGSKLIINNSKFDGSNIFNVTGNNTLTHVISDGSIFNRLQTLSVISGNIQMSDVTISSTNSSTITGSSNISITDSTIDSKLNISVTGDITLSNSTLSNESIFSSNLLTINNSSTLSGDNQYTTLGLLSITGSILSGTGVYTLDSLSINTSTLSENSRFTIVTAETHSNFITDSTISDLHFININSGDLSISNSSITYKNDESYIILASGIFSIINSIITDNTPNTTFYITIGGVSAAHTISNSNLDSFSKINVTDGNLTINYSRIMSNSYILTGGNIYVTNSYLDTTGTSVPINILTGSVNTYKFSLDNSVIDISTNKALATTFDDSSSFIQITNSTLNINYNTPNMTTLTQDRDWFSTSNIINFNSGTTIISNYTNNKDINITSDGNLTFLTNTPVINSIINIHGMKRTKTAITPVTTNSYGFTIENTTSTSQITFKDFIMSGLTNLSIINPKYYINYNEDNNTSCVMSVIISNIIFYLSPNVYSINFGSLPILISASYRIYIETDGIYYIGADQLVLKDNIDQNIYVNSNNLTNVSLLGTNENNTFIHRLIVNFELLTNVINSEFSLTVNAKGLDLYDNRSVLTNIQTIKLSESNIDMSSVSDSVNALEIHVNTTKSSIIIDNSTFTTNNDNSFIYLYNTNNSTTANRVVTINNNNTWIGSVNYFIHNLDNTLLVVNGKPSNSIVAKNTIYWPYLIDMSLESNPISNPLLGSAVQFAESWITNTFVTIDNNLNSTSGGLSADWYNNTNKSLKFVQAYSYNAFGETLTSLKYSLSKDHNNTTTYHTGKFSGYFDDYIINHTDAKGLVTADILFNSSELVLMPPTNSVNIIVKINDTLVEKFNKKIYQINNSTTIIKSNITKTIEEYLTENIIIYDTSNAFVNNTISMNDTTFLIDDGSGNIITTVNSQSVSFKINPIIGNHFYFLRPVNIKLSQASITLTYTPSDTIIYPNIDNVNDNGNSDSVTISIPKNNIKWTNTSFDIDIICSLYYTGTDPSLTITINNQTTDAQLYAIKLGEIVDNKFIYNISQSYNTSIPISEFLTLDNTNFTATNLTNIDNKYEWNLASFGLLVPAIEESSSTSFINFTPSITNIKLDGIAIDNTITDANHVIIELKRYNYNNSAWVVNDNNTITSSDSDILIRYMINVKLENVQDKYYGNDYVISFDITNTNFTTYYPLSISINSFRLPLIAKVTKVTTDDIVRNTEFDMKVELSGKINGFISLSFTDTGTNISDNLNTIYSYNNILNDCMKFIDVDNSQHNFNYLIDMGGENNKTLTYKISPVSYSIGDFKMNCSIDKVTDNSNTEYTITTKYDKNNIQYNETLDHTITITMDKLLDTAGYEKFVNIDYNNAATNNKLKITDEDSTNYLIAHDLKKKIGSSLANNISSTHLLPINKFTRYFIAINTTSLGVGITDTTFSLQYVTTNIIFKDEDDNIVDDIQVVKISNGNIVNSTSEIIIDNLAYENLFNGTLYTTSGNDVLIFRRNPDANNEALYTKLYVYYNFTNLSNSNYRNLPSGNQLLGFIDFTNTGLSSIKTSTITIGNFRIKPTGDGKYLMFSDAISTDLSIPNDESAKYNVSRILLTLTDI
jgi:hypothetical protein